MVLEQAGGAARERCGRTSMTLSRRLAGLQNAHGKWAVKKVLAGRPVLEIACAALARRPMLVETRMAPLPNCDLQHCSFPIRREACRRRRSYDSRLAVVLGILVRHRLVQTNVVDCRRVQVSEIHKPA